jgi:hypothetical protein
VAQISAKAKLFRGTSLRLRRLYGKQGSLSIVVFKIFCNPTCKPLWPNAARVSSCFGAVTTLGRRCYLDTNLECSNLSNTSAKLGRTM